MGRSILKFFCFPAVAGLCAAAPAIGAHPPAAWLAAAAREPYHGPMAAVASWLWNIGGAGAISGVHALLLWLAWTAGFHILLRVGGVFGRRGLPSWVVPAGICLAAGWGLVTGVTAVLARDPLSSAHPIELVGDVRGKTVFASPSAVLPLALWGDSVNLTPTADLREMMADPKKWRSAARAAGWNAVLLTGPADEVTPLLRHLLGSPDWRLSRMDAHGWTFFRDGKPAAALPDPADVAGENPRSTARTLARMADRFHTAGDLRGARAAINRALELAPGDAVVQLWTARFYGTIKRWHEAIKYADRAIHGGMRTPAAYSTKAIAALESGDIPSARAAAERALAIDPDDRYTLFLVAKICRADRDLAAEIQTLKRLVAASGKPPDGAALAYLGQAYAMDGNAEASAAAYRGALEAPNLDKAQRDAIREALANVEKHIR